MRAGLRLILIVWCFTGAEAEGQSVLERSPNIQGVWGLRGGEATFGLAHRFEVLEGGDELFSIPTLTFAVGLPFGITAGVDFTSYSEAIPGNITRNEAQYWLKRPATIVGRLQAAGLAGYNAAAESGEAAVDLRYPAGRLEIFAEGRGHSSLFGSGDAAASGTIGAAVRLNRHVALTGDVGRVLTEDTVPSAWSAALAVEIPSSPHTLSLQMANSGATTLQGVSRRKTVGSEDYRYGFAFTVPLGSGSRWRRILDPLPPPPPLSDSLATPTVTMVNTAFTPAEIRVRVGEEVRWINLDPIAHTVTAQDRSWDSGRLEEGEVYQRRFDAPGRFVYICLPHPGMQGVVVVED